ncbi:uncharacterized protein MYCFIDRAFT_180069 [Pseudocercospora fijiensis CIRAD86]|uniref:Uncharacterized protein n=1 Tax=Pseudocercospora fijiensis (strain CIRAD86) TaxID=383855 RepID=M3AI84_PSEFD|nr:uncharacterized protein MYCFIDRAFT_180069 [Pseudocercospora fijiensis CIRAD86]EME77192.1 hypothetical protein MYCFIDRAFT_180069 [Pseudocercospora fijiensis CIRAD86]
MGIEQQHCLGPIFAKRLKIPSVARADVRNEGSDVQWTSNIVFKIMESATGNKKDRARNPAGTCLENGVRSSICPREAHRVHMLAIGFSRQDTEQGHRLFRGSLLPQKLEAVMASRRYCDFKRCAFASGNLLNEAAVFHFRTSQEVGYRSLSMQKDDQRKEGSPPRRDSCQKSSNSSTERTISLTVAGRHLQQRSPFSTEWTSSLPPAELQLVHLTYFASHKDTVVSMAKLLSEVLTYQEKLTDALTNYLNDMEATTYARYSSSIAHLNTTEYLGIHYAPGKRPTKHLPDKEVIAPTEPVRTNPRNVHYFRHRLQLTDKAPRVLYQDVVRQLGSVVLPSRQITLPELENDLSCQALAQEARDRDTTDSQTLTGTAAYPT